LECEQLIDWSSKKRLGVDAHVEQERRVALAIHARSLDLHWGGVLVHEKVPPPDVVVCEPTTHVGVLDAAPQNDFSTSDCTSTDSGGTFRTCFEC